MFLWLLECVSTKLSDSAASKLTDNLKKKASNAVALADLLV